MRITCHDPLTSVCLYAYVCASLLLPHRSLPSTSLLVLPLPDSMYLRAPASLKDLRQQQQQAAVAGAVAAFEFGGLLRSVEGGLQRVVVRYDAAAADGGFVEATREVFVP